VTATTTTALMVIVPATIVLAVAVDAAAVVAWMLRKVHAIAVRQNSYLPKDDRNPH
jgi:hypothetical protein